jgi:hypothetical protein
MIDKLIFGSITTPDTEPESNLDEFGYDKTARGYVFVLQARRFTEQYGTLEFPIRDKTLDEMLGVA